MHPPPGDPAALSAAPVAADLKAWFAAEIQVHEQALRNWLRVRYPSLTDRDDLVQDAFLRVWQACHKGPISNPKAFLFTIAKNLAYNTRLKNSRQSNLGDNPLLTVMDDSMSVPDSVSRTQEIEILRAAVEALPDRCREVFVLRRLHGLSQKETAARLGLSEKTIENQHSIAMHKCMEFFEKKNLKAPAEVPDLRPALPTAHA